MRALLLALLGWCLAAPALAQDREALLRAYEISKGEERILSFVSDVTIARNGDLDVTETIRLVSLADQIRHGIQRDFPTLYSAPLLQKSRVGFRLLSVTRDGAPEPAEEMDLDNGVRIRIGRAEEMLPPGEHVYAIRYRTTRQIRYGAQADELYWNATGTGWQFPIDMAEARIRLPLPARFGERTVYTGPQGATEHNADVVREEPGLIVFRTTAPLPRENGLTVAVSFPKGVLNPPGADRRLRWWLQDWGALLTAALTVVGMAVYYLYAWARVGHGPRAGTVVPAFAPPERMSAAAVRYVQRMRLDNRAFTAAIVQLGVLGALRIRKEDGGWFKRDVTTIEDTGAGEPPAAEADMRRALFAAGGALVLKQDNHETLQAARSALSSGLERAYAARFFARNRGWSWFGAALVPVSIVLVAWVSVLALWPDVHWTIVVLAPLALGSLGAAWLLFRRVDNLKGPGLIFGWIGIGLMAVLAALAGMGALAAGVNAGGWPVLAPLVILPLTLSAFRWMPAPTPEGRRVMDQIAGFRHYLGITEEERLEALHPPEKTPELFERYLPYAIALDVENRWADRFTTVLAAAAAAGAAHQTASWYSGDGNVWDDPGGFASSVGSSLESTVSSASTSPSSSSGSGGGGSSGGGGGGGGGSGW
jgi:uncharacterized membrane protein YgcG